MRESQMRATWLAMALMLGAVAAFARDLSEDEREILRAEAVLCRAFVTVDVDVLREGLDRHFTLTDSRGVVSTLEQVIAELESRDPVYEVFRNHGQTVRLYGDAAVVTGITTIRGHSDSAPFANDFQFTDTWVYREGRWLMAASHVSRLPSETP